MFRSRLQQVEAVPAAVTQTLAETGAQVALMPSLAVSPPGWGCWSFGREVESNLFSSYKLFFSLAGIAVTYAFLLVPQPVSLLCELFPTEGAV